MQHVVRGPPTLAVRPVTDEFRAQSVSRPKSAATRGVGEADACLRHVPFGSPPSRDRRWPSRRCQASRPLLPRWQQQDPPRVQRSRHYRRLCRKQGGQHKPSSSRTSHSSNEFVVRLLPSTFRLEKPQERHDRLMQEIASVAAAHPQDAQDPVAEVIRLKAKVAQLQAKSPTRGSEEAHQNFRSRVAKRRAGFLGAEDVVSIWDRKFTSGWIRKNKNCEKLLTWEIWNLSDS